MKQSGARWCAREQRSDNGAREIASRVSNLTIQTRSLDAQGVTYAQPIRQAQTKMTYRR